MKNVAVAAALLFAAGLAGAAARDKVTEEVIVEGTRPEVEQRVNTFVKGVTHRGYAVESLVICALFCCQTPLGPRCHTSSKSSSDRNDVASTV